MFCNQVCRPVLFIPLLLCLACEAVSAASFQDLVDYTQGKDDDQVRAYIIKTWKGKYGAILKMAARASAENRVALAGLLVQAGESMAKQGVVGRDDRARDPWQARLARQPGTGRALAALLTSKPALLKQTIDGYSLLDVAHPDNVVTILQAGFPANELFQGTWPLHRALRRKDLKKVMLLLAAGADPNCSKGSGGNRRTALSLAVGTGDRRFIDVLIAAGARTDDAALLFRSVKAGTFQALHEHGIPMPKTDEHGHSLLQIACDNGDLALAAALLNAGQDVNQRTKFGTALHAARRHPGIVAMLLRAGAKVDILDDNGNTALHGAWPECLQLLLQAGADPNLLNKFGNSPLAASPTAARVRLLLAHGAKINHGGYPALHMAIERNHLGGFFLLLEAGADVDRADKRGETALHVAVREKNIYYKTIVSRSKAIDARDTRYGYSALAHACTARRLSIVQDLLARGADPVGNGWRKPPLLVALCSSEDIATDPIVRVLIKAGADPQKLRVAGGGNALHYMAQQWDKVKAVQWLIAQGVDHKHKNEAGQTPGDLARESERGEYARLLP